MKGYRKLSRGVRLLFVFCFMTIVMLPNSVFGKLYKGISPEELEGLPRWCQIRIISHNRMRGNAEGVPDSVWRENSRYAKFFGPIVYNAAHHYCLALIWINRYKRSSLSLKKDVVRDRKFALKSALADLQFMKNVKTLEKSKLYIPVLMNMAYIYKEQGDVKGVVENYTEIIKNKPGYALAYVEYARYLSTYGKNTDALNILRLGLKNTKDAPIIKQVLVDIEKGGGNN